MARNIFTLFYINLISEIVLFMTNAVDIQRQAFVQTDNELRYLVDGISLHLHENFGNEAEFAVPNTNEMAASQSFSSPIVLSPAVLDFKEISIGMPRLARVVVSNSNYHINVFLLSISGNSVNFHCSFFKDKVISPGENTTFDVVFLSRTEGAVQNTLYIHTSVGSFKYKVQGVGTPNPYRLRPFVGAKVPINSIYSPIISMYNPHRSTLQITEMYSSGGDLHLELPTGEKEAIRNLWEIPPYETKSVMRANFLAREANNHTAYIRIKTNLTSNDYLVLPVEVEVSAASGIYSTSDSLEFGVLYSKDAPKSLILSLLNHSQKPVMISSVSVSPFNKAVTINFNAVKILPNTGVAAQVAAITFNPKLALDPNSCSGNIVVRTKSSQFKLSIKYRATVLQGSLDYNSNNLEFYVGDALGNDAPLQKNITLKNTFDVSIAIFEAELSEEAKNHFNVVLNDGVVLHPDQTLTVGYVSLKKCNDVMLLNTFIRLRTNISEFKIPLLCYNGKLTPFVPLTRNMSTNSLEVGTLSINEKRDVLMAVINGNPVNVKLKRFGATLAHIVVELLAVHNKNISEMMDKMSFSGMAKTLILAPSHFAIFRVGISAPSIEESFQGEVFIETVFETFRIPISFKTAVGSLSIIPSYLTLQSAFPGRVSTVPLYIQSNFEMPMTVTSIAGLRDDNRFTYISLKDSPVLKPHSKTMVGWLQFDVRNDCERFCYLGFDANSTIGIRWLSSFKLSYGVAAIDMDLYQSLSLKWTNVTQSKRHEQNLTFVLDTTEVRGFLFQSVVSLIWPKLAVKSKILFPLTQIGNYSLADLILENTASVSIVLQVIPIFAYPHSSAILNSLLKRNERLPDTMTFNESVFRLQNRSFSIGQLPLFLQSPSHPEGIALLLKSGEKVRIPVTFSPTSEVEASTFLIIRNNLTVLETVLLQGSGALCEIRFGSRAPGSSTPLLFELTEKHLKDCEGSPFPQYALPNFAVRRAFTIRNTGLLPIYVSGFEISSSPCEGYGFRVLNCQGFLLNSNSSKKIDIAFTPDFTLARVQRELIIRTSMGSGGQTLSFILLATIPPYLLSRCASILPRPQWEIMLYYVTVCLMLFALFCVLVTAYLESDRIIRCTFVAMTVTSVPELKLPFPGDLEPFDLKRIAAKGLPASATTGRSQVMETQTVSSNNRTDNCRGRKNGYSSRVNNTYDINNLMRTPNLNSILQRLPPESAEKVSDRKIKESSCGTESEPKNKKSVKLKKLVKSHSLNNEADTNNTNTSGNSNKTFRRNRKYSQESNDLNIDDKSCSSTNSENDKSKSKSKEEGCTSRILKEKCNRAPNTTKEKKFTEKTRNEIKYKPVKKSTEEVTEEDSSSTTTESSSPDFDSSEKEPQNDDTIWYRKEKRNTIACIEKVEDADDEDTSNGQWIQRTSEHRNTHRQRISSSVVELPFKINPLRSSSGDKPWLCWEVEDERKKSKSRSLTKFGNTKSSVKVGNDGESSSTGKDSPPPLWDQITVPSNSDDAYEKLAKNTETFAMRRKGYIHQNKSWSTKKRVNSQDGRVKVNRDKENEASGFTGKSSSLCGKAITEPKKRSKDTQLPKPIGAIGQRLPSHLSLSVNTDHWKSGGVADSTSPIMGTPSTPPEFNSYSSQPFMDYDQIMSRRQLSSSAFDNQWKTPGSNLHLDPMTDSQHNEKVNQSSGWSSFSDNYSPSNLWNSEINSGSGSSSNVWLPLNGYEMPNEVGIGSLEEMGIWNNSSLDSLNPIGWPSSSQWSSLSTSSNNVSNSVNLPKSIDEKARSSTIAAPEYNPFNTLPTIWSPSSLASARPEDWNNSYFFPTGSRHNSEDSNR